MSLILLRPSTHAYHHIPLITDTHIMSLIASFAINHEMSHQNAAKRKLAIISHNLEGSWDFLLTKNSCMVFAIAHASISDHIRIKLLICSYVMKNIINV